jgi:hypothetical protein
LFNLKVTAWKEIKQNQGQINDLNQIEALLMYFKNGPPNSLFGSWAWNEPYY